ncbi:MAG TPA: DUF1330 domain-containing protein [Myxococcales bacterium]|jgi:uncharacterized protein (DUF1330 family)|nr:DUF1330 domain-containing protein [Myxococcales bacterium]
MAIEPGTAELERFRAADDGRPVVLFQLLRFAEGGRDAYLKYASAAQAVLIKLGAQVLYAGEAGPPLMGEGWDGIVITRYPTRATYLQLLADPDYQRIAPLRRAALREAALLPTNDWPPR